MNAKKSGRFGVLAASALLMGLGLTQMAACADNRASLFIRGVRLPTDENCTFTSDPGSNGFVGPSGTLDLGLAASVGRDYELVLLVESHLVRRADSTKLRSESDIVNLTYADVRLETLNEAIIDEFQVPVHGVVDPAVGTDAGFGLVGVPIIPVGTIQNHGSEMAAEGLIKAFVVVGGYTSGDSDLESSEWEFPIQVCANCVCPSGQALFCEDDGYVCGVDPAYIGNCACQ